jgi:hypothetical protein
VERHFPWRVRVLYPVGDRVAVGRESRATVRGPTRFKQYDSSHAASFTRRQGEVTIMPATRTSVLPATGFPPTAGAFHVSRSQLVEIRREREANPPHKSSPAADEHVVQEQLRRILGSLFFRNSDRYTRLLKYIVDTALHGDPALLKERLIGMNVFGRDPSYDTVKDNVVRIAAAEVRGRLVRYYALPEHRGELRIILSPGSYVPQFSTADAVPQPRPQPQQASSDAEESALRKFWRPLLESLEPILIVLGPTRALGRKQPLRANAAGDYHKFSEQITLSDALTLSKVVSYLESCGKEYRVEMQDFVRFRDLRNGPAILLGGFNNQWTLSFAQHLRFAFKSNRGRTKTWICDSETPSQQHWIHDWSLPLPAMTEDHAIVARVLHSETGHAIVIAGGHMACGTAAAGEFVTNSSYLENAITGDSCDWTYANLELVIATSVVRGVSGPPRVSASYVW